MSRKIPSFSPEAKAARAKAVAERDARREAIKADWSARKATVAEMNKAHRERVAARDERIAARIANRKVTKLFVSLHAEHNVFEYSSLSDAVSAIHQIAHKHGYVCLVDYKGDEPQLSWQLIQMSDNRTVGRAYAETH